MHARPDELLSLRDGEPVGPEAAAHVRGCDECRAEIARLAALRERLTSLPAAPQPARDSWMLVRERLAARSRARSAPGRFASVVSVAALVVFAALWGSGRSDRGAAPTVTVTDVSVEEPVLAELQARSQALEALLAAMPERPAVARAGTAVPIDALEAQVQWLDHQLSGSQDDVDAPRARALWRDRVEVMNSLVQLRYVEMQSAQL